jgi:DNA ligase (NAD+)
LGDTVLVERAGDVIPYIVKPIVAARDGSEAVIEFPTYCPINDTNEAVELIRSEGEVAWRCPNCVCGKQDLQRMIFFVSKEAMNIDGLGKSIVQKFYEMGWIRDFTDIYNLDYNAIESLEGFGTKSAEKLRTAIEKSKQNSLARLLFSLGIHHLGKRASKILAQHISHVLDLAKWTEEDFTIIKDIGPVLASNATEFFSIQQNIDRLKLLETSGVNVRQTEADRPIAVSESSPLYGKSILFTGSLQELKRKEAQEMATRAGARNISAVSAKLDILVVGEKAGSKLKKAQALGTVEIMTEAEFLEIMK